MVVYADLIFLLNGYIDFLLLWLTSGIRKQKTSMWRLLSAAAVGGMYSMLQLWPQFALAFFFPIKILVSMVMVWIAYGFRHPTSYLRNLGVFYLVCFIAGGALIALHYVFTGDSQVAGGIFLTQSANGWGSPVSLLLIICGFPLVWGYTKYSLRSLEERQTVNQYLTQIKLSIGGKEVECTGLIDTGNQLRDPVTRTPVMMVELEQLESRLPLQLKQMVQEKDWEKGWLMLPPEWMTKVRVIPYRVAGNKGEMMIALKPDQVKILKENQWNNVGKVLIGIDVGRLSSDGTYQAIIHPSCLSV
ncbi:sigma-E processing peptidase SpoIIGA [Paenactinomyces guangxiensis]|uniref:Sporulation sigma-E factor-processing peptidase n=1 Tax=Paenactinomyces guangxiensis TaxID=1490290 RepID=A0A7W2A834_9BACL|nr:sigma-E processing peptidase SpoIIGA [Paenactinomyces guangxiensis]MBA4494240.1 sigma-E processing peptidase SpoIIGA [Paenactinomyces guangxiensis]MBH8590736.1 sigma-E processing peptidase SpoIIGA [Paenactinomyces guangxiensis]